MKERIRILIADDQHIAREGLKVLLCTWPDLEIVGEAAHGEEAVQQAARLRPDVVLMDVRMPDSARGSGRDTGGLEATRRIKENWPEVRIIILTMYGTYHREALEAKADSFMLKGSDPEQLITTIRQLGRGGKGHDTGTVQYSTC